MQESISVVKLLNCARDKHSYTQRNQINKFLLNTFIVHELLSPRKKPKQYSIYELKIVSILLHFSKGEDFRANGTHPTRKT